MAFDQAKELRPLNIHRTMAEDPRIVQGISSGRPIEMYYANPHRDSGNSPESAPAVYYPAAAVADAGLVPRRLNNGVTGWVPPTAPAQHGVVGGGGINSNNGGYAYSPPYRMPSGGSSSDQASDEGSEELVMGRKLKFLCSYGGKILPRPSDGALRYVGGQTRIVNVKRDVSFTELVQKVDAYGQNLVIKYQLPGEDLDALVSVSGPDDLENMMDEYEKLVERSSDESAKLRLFLFLPSEFESSGLAHVGDLQDGGQSYVEAVNGMLDGCSSSSGVSSRIARKESVDSAGSTQNSDMSGTEGSNSLVHGRGDIIGALSTGGLYVGGTYTVSRETSPRTARSDTSPSVHMETSTSPLGIQMVKVPEQEVERSVPLAGMQPQGAYDLQQLGVSPYAYSPYVQAYVDPHQEAINHADYASQLHSQMGFRNQLSGAVGPMPTQQNVAPPASSHQFVTAVHVSSNPSLVSMKPNSVTPLVQPQQVRYENYPAESVVSPPGIAYGLHQVPLSEKVALVEGGLPSQSVLVSDKLPRLKDCYMCQKALPHAHSDTVAQNQKETSPSGSPDSRSIYQSLRLDHQSRPMNIEQPVAVSQPGFSQNVEGHYRKDRMLLQVETPENTNISAPQGMMTTGIPSPYGVYAANNPQFSQGNTVQHVVVSPQNQVTQDATTNRQVNNNISPVGSMPLQTSEYIVPSVKVPCTYPKEDSTSAAFNYVRQIDGRLENLQVAARGHPNIHNLPPLESYETPEPPLLCTPNLYPRPNLGINQLALHEISSIKLAHSGIESDRVSERIPAVGEWKEDVATWSQPRSSADVEDGMQGGYKPSSASPDKPDNSIQSSGSLNKDLNLEHAISSKDDMTNQELRAVAEGAASSAHHSFAEDAETEFESAQETGEDQGASTEMQQRHNFEDIKINLSEKIQLGSPVSHGIGRLQIIKDSDLEELRELGSGTFGTVYHGKWRGTDVAIKRINDRLFIGKPSEQERMIDDFWNEAVKLADLHHPNVVAFYGVVLDGPGGSVATVTEYMVNGSLRNALQKSERMLDKRKQLMIVMDVAFGMEYLHGRNIVHFDLKSDNLLVNLRDPHRPICKVGDLGLSRVKCHTLISGSVRGTLPWMAPELLNGSSSLVSEKVDVFSFGIVMWELLTGEEPYTDLHYGAIIGGIVSNTLRPPVPESCNPDWRSLMERCWSTEPSERPSFTEIANELQSMAAKLPLKRQVQQPLP